MPEDRTRCSSGNLGRFEEHSVTRSCVWGERCRGNPRLEQNKTEDAGNKIFWGWIVISWCKMCLLLCKNEGLAERLLPFLKSGVFLCMMHISLCHNTLYNKDEYLCVSAVEIKFISFSSHCGWNLLFLIFNFLKLNSVDTRLSFHLCTMPSYFPFPFSCLISWWEGKPRLLPTCVKEDNTDTDNHVIIICLGSW